MSLADATIGRTRIIAAPPDSAPCTMDAIVEEQDTTLVLDIEPVIRQPKETYSTLVDDMVEQQPLVPGDVIVRQGEPLRFLAIIHDLDSEPTCTAGAVAIALENLLQLFNEHRIKSAAIPLLGTVHGRFNDETFMTLLYNALQTEPLQYTEMLWLITPEPESERIIRHLRRRFGNNNAL